MKIDLVNDIKSDIKVVFLNTKSLRKYKYSKVLDLAGFSAEQDSVCFLHEKAVLVCGIQDSSNDNIRSVCSIAIKTLKVANYKSVCFDVTKDNTQAIVEGIILGGYEYNRYKSKPTKTKLKNVYLACGNISKVKSVFEQSIIIAEATCFTRDIVNTIPEDLNPPSFAVLAKKLAKDNGLECEILGEKELAKEKMDSMLAVGRASRHDSKLIHLIYKPKKKPKQ